MGSIHVSRLGKAYKQYPTRWSRLAEWMLPFRGPRHKLKWVLQDIDFAISPGEAIGIIGINGAGKSTLLKLITGTTQASAGSIQTSGRIAALLELGMGFHPDVTGRNNIVMAGQLMGLTMDEIATLMPEIIGFAEIGEHIDSPVRVYSSGMQMRLAFSVATCARPDILIVDEALAVGDVFFQQKCFDRIRQFTEAGTTLLFVSHSTGTVLKTCTRCLFIENGALAFDGAPKEAIDLYQAALLGRQDRAGHAFQVTAGGGTAHMEAARERHDFLVREAVPLDGKAGSIRTGRAECVCARFVDAGGTEQLTLVADGPATLQLEFRVEEELDDPHAGFKIRDRFGVVLFETNTYCMRAHLGAAAAGSILAVRFAFTLSLRPDEYTITVGLANGGYGDGQFREVICYLHEVSALAVLPNPDAITWAGAVNLSPQLSFEKY